MAAELESPVFVLKIVVEFEIFSSYRMLHAISWAICLVGGDLGLVL